jgi:hypothetical protein
MPLHTQILFHSQRTDLLAFQSLVLRLKDMILTKNWILELLLSLFIPVLFSSFMIDEEVDGYITFLHICYRIDRTGPIAASSIAGKALYQA